MWAQLRADRHKRLRTVAPVENQFFSCTDGGFRYLLEPCHMHDVVKTTSTQRDLANREKPKQDCCKSGGYLQKSGEFIRKRYFAYRRQSNQMMIGGVGIDTTDSCSTERFRISSMVLVCA